MKTLLIGKTTIENVHTEKIIINKTKDWKTKQKNAKSPWKIITKKLDYKRE